MLKYKTPDQSQELKLAELMRADAADARRRANVGVGAPVLKPHKTRSVTISDKQRIRNGYLAEPFPSRGQRR
jgi:hypothetical protein